jgi:DNA-binding transcriptional LysR family regulator
MIVTWEYIDAFHAVMTSGSVTHAAQILGRSQPTVSRLIRRLEDVTRLTLFDRSGTRLLPTEEAEALFRELRPSYRSLDQLQRTIEDVRMMRHVTIRIATLPALSLNVIPDCLCEMQKVFPDIRIMLQVRNSLAVRDLVRSGAADVGFVSDGFSQGGVKAELAASTECVLVYNPDAFSLPPLIRNFSCLSELPFLTYPREDVLRRKIEEQFRLAGASLNVVCEAAYGQHICMLASRGLGVGIISPLSVVSAPPHEVAVARLAKLIDSRIYSVQRVGTQQNRQTATFLELTRKYIARGMRQNLPSTDRRRQLVAPVP